MENSPAALELSSSDSQLLHRILVQDVDTAASIYQNSREASCSPISGKCSLQNHSIGTWTRHHLWVVRSAPTDRLLGPVHELQGVYRHRINFLLLQPPA